MRGAIRLLVACGLIAVVGVIAASGSGAATTAQVGGMNPLLRSRLAPTIGTENTTSFAGYITGPASTSSSASTTFKVPKSTGCTTTNTGVVLGAFMEDKSGTTAEFDGAGVFTGCISGTAHVNPTMTVGGAGVAVPTTDKAFAGDTLVATVSVGSGGTTVTLHNTNTTRSWTFTKTGTDTSPQDELIGVDSGVVNNVPVGPSTFALAHFTASTVGGAALKSAAAIDKLVWVASTGCSTVLLPSAIDTTGKIFTVKAPLINITSISPTSGPAGTVVTIIGKGFNSSSAVIFKGGPASAVTHTSTTQLQATAPTAVKTGPITVKNTTAPIGQIASACTFTKT